MKYLKYILAIVILIIMIGTCTKSKVKLDHQYQHNQIAILDSKIDSVGVITDSLKSSLSVLKPISDSKSFKSVNVLDKLSDRLKDSLNTNEKDSVIESLPGLIDSVKEVYNYNDSLTNLQDRIIQTQDLTINDLKAKTIILTNLNMSLETELIKSNRRNSFKRIVLIIVGILISTVAIILLIK